MIHPGAQEALEYFSAVRTNISDAPCERTFRHLIGDGISILPDKALPARRKLWRRQSCALRCLGSYALSSGWTCRGVAEAARQGTIPNDLADPFLKRIRAHANTAEFAPMTVIRDFYSRIREFSSN